MKKKDEDIKAEKWNKFDIEKTLSKFAIDEPFYSSISSNIDKYPTKSIDTAGITIQNGKPVLLYNEDFFNSLNWKHKQGLLIHEFLHIIFNHSTSRKKLDKNGNPDHAWFVACDYSINSLIDEERLPAGGLLPGRWECPKKQPINSNALDDFKNMVLGWPKGESADWYYEQIKSNGDFGNICENLNLTDDHNNWEPLSSEDKEILEVGLKKIMEDAVIMCEDGGWGSISREFQQQIKRLCQSKIDWISLLRQFIGNSITIHFSSTIKKINRRFPYIHPGKKRKRETKVVICIDQSGSINEKALSTFFGELEKLSEITEFVVVPFDSNVIEKEIFTWEKGERINTKRVARGGTDFDVPTVWVNKNCDKFDAAIFMTDGFCNKPSDCKVPRTWIICKNGKLMFQTYELVINM